MKIDCDTCTAGPRACGDCFVSFLTIPVRPGTARAAGSETTPAAGHSPHGLELDAAQARAVLAMAAGGLVPPLRHVSG